jgi:hypothetical protein
MHWYRHELKLGFAEFCKEGGFDCDKNDMVCSVSNTSWDWVSSCLTLEVMENLSLESRTHCILATCMWKHRKKVMISISKAVGYLYSK